MPGMFAPPAKPADTVEDSRMKPKPVYNIVLLGQTQAGKSTFLQGIRKYADPDCIIDDSLIGNGNQSCTSEVKMQEVDTNFSQYHVYKTEDEKVERRSVFSYFSLFGRSGANKKLDVKSFLDCSLQEYRARIDQSDGLEIRQDEISNCSDCTVRIFDTPGLEDTNHQDERNVSGILTTLSKEKAVHLVLLVISRGTPLTPGLQEALNTYSKIFSAMNGLFLIIHTQFNYRIQHPDDKKWKDFNDRKESLDKIMGRKMVHFTIDCDLDEERPIQIYLRQKTIRDILFIATLNVPVELNSMQLYKTRKMRDVDELVGREQAINKANIEAEYKVLDTAIDLDIRINKLQYDIRELSEFICNNDNNNEEFMHEERYEEGWGLFTSRKEAELQVYNLPFAIDNVHVHCEGVDVLHHDGGHGNHHWYVKLKRGWFAHGVYHAKMYVQRCNKMRQQINEKRSEIDRSRGEQDRLGEERGKMPLGGDTNRLRQELKEKQGKCLNLITRAHRETLHLNLFNALVEASVYEGSPAECVKKVTEFYASYVPAQGEEVMLEIEAFQDIFNDQLEQQTPTENELGDEFDMVSSLDGITLGSSDEHGNEHETTTLPSEINISSAAVIHSSAAVIHSPAPHVYTESESLKPATSSATETLKESSSIGVEEHKFKMETPPDSINFNPTFNIVLLGQTQSGKSTFIQSVRSYADPSCEIDHETIGNGNSSCTTDVRVHTIETNFPLYRLFRTGGHHRPNHIQHVPNPFQNHDREEEQEVDMAEFIGNCTPSQFQKKVNQTQGLELYKDDHSGFSKHTIRIFDTPGLDDTNSHDERNVANILAALFDAGAVHLVLIMISRTAPMTPSLRTALTNYSNIFSPFGGLMALVHTKVPVKVQYTHDAKFEDFIDERSRDLMQIMGRKIPHYLLDCDLEEDRPALLYFTRYIIRSLLVLARFNVPAPLNRIQLHKTRWMMDIDGVIISEFKKKLENIQEKNIQLDNRIFDLDLKITDARYRIREFDEYVSNHDTEDLELVYEERFEQNWELFGFRQETVLESPKLDYTIDEVRLDMSGIEVKQSQGGKGCNYWSMKLIRQFFHLGTFHVKLYVKRCNINRQEILRQTVQREACIGELRNLRTQRYRLDCSDTVENIAMVERQRLKNEQSECLNMITRAERKTLHLNLFKAITDAQVYEGRIQDCVEKVKGFYSRYVPKPGEEASMEQGGAVRYSS
ncbi:hypothetical protein BGZ46_002275 [Entomortierella lignicola]|nr:hypothetical protein BGZ46_002275 [Entomortierella lignicola]